MSQFIFKNEQIIKIERIRKNLVDEDFFKYMKKYHFLLNNVDDNKNLLIKFEDEIKKSEYCNDFIDNNFIWQNIAFEYPNYVMDDSGADNYLTRKLLALNNDINENVIKKAIKLYYKNKSRI